MAARVALIGAQVEALAGVAPGDLGGAGALELFDSAYELADRLQGVAVRALPVVEADGLWGLGGARTFSSWVAARARMTRARAKRLVRLGRALVAELPVTAAAVVTGGPDRVTVEVAEMLTTIAATSERRREVLADPDQVVGETFLVDQSRALSADTLRTLLRRWAAAADPAADERGYKDVTEREFFEVSPTTGGCHLSGFLTTEHGQGLLVALQAVTGVPAADDERTTAQRRAGALSDLARLTLDQGLVGAGSSVRPHLSVLVDFPTLTALAAAAGVGDLLDPALLHPAVFEDGEPVPRTVLERLACDGDISRVVFGPDSQVLNVGRARRRYTGAQRRAVIARDKHCQYPGCDAPPRLCECHHCRHWIRDHGDTDVRTGILLCFHHHAHVHDHGIEIVFTPGPGWQFTDRHGQPLRR